jgi:PAS domain-containing protein
MAREAREACGGPGADESRRMRNRDHARQSRSRKKLVVDSLQDSLVAFEQENERLRAAVRSGLGAAAAAALAGCAAGAAAGRGGDALLAAPPRGTDGVDCRVIDKYDYGLLAALRSAHRSFVITDPTMPDNPIIFASGGFLELTGYDLGQILGRNCRFLQGPRTNAAAVEKIRKGISEGNDVQVRSASGPCRGRPGCSPATPPRHASRA